jgi:hypothetical protein
MIKGKENNMKDDKPIVSAEFVVIVLFALILACIVFSGCRPRGSLVLWVDGKPVKIADVAGATSFTAKFQKAEIAENIYITEIHADNKSKNEFLQIGADSAKYLILDEMSDD